MFTVADQGSYKRFQSSTRMKVTEKGSSAVHTQCKSGLGAAAILIPPATERGAAARMPNKSSWQPRSSLRCMSSHMTMSCLLPQGHGHGHGHGHGGNGAAKKPKAIPIPDIREVETHYRDYLPLFSPSLTYLHGKGEHSRQSWQPSPPPPPTTAAGGVVLQSVLLGRTRASPEETSSCCSTFGSLCTHWAVRMPG